MRLSGAARRIAWIVVATGLASLSIPSTPRARADVTPAPSCAATAPSQPSAPTAGNPCWTDVTPYPFGADGNPAGSDPGATAETVNSLDFRAWNRGLAAINPTAGSPYTVWLFNGTRWFPDPTFPGPSVCSGSTVLWAGKLDYWLIGGNYNASTGASGVCRFDGVNFQWDPIQLPAGSQSQSATLSAGSCFAWNNCWFFGAHGVVDHWDGQTLSGVSSGLGVSPWLQGRYTAAAGGLDAAGGPFALAVTEASAVDGGQPLPPEPGSPPTPAPQVFGSLGGTFAPSASGPLAAAGASAPSVDWRAVATDEDGGWVAGNPIGATPSSLTTATISTAQPSPLLPVTTTGGPVPCTGYGLDTFSEAPNNSGQPSWLWQTVSADPASGAALAGGLYIDPNGQRQPGLVGAQCGQPPRATLFRTAVAPGAPPSTTPADVNGFITAVADNASNDAWAATTQGNNDGNFQSPHLYRLTDGQPPDAAAGDDDETRPIVFQIDPTIFVQSPGVVAPPPVVAPTVTVHKSVKKRVKLKAAIYDVKSTKPVVGRRGRITLTIKFKVRRSVTIGLEGIRGGKVVSSSGLRHFRPGTGHLALVLDRKHWPTRLKFITPPAKKHVAQDIVSGPIELTWAARIPA